MKKYNPYKLRIMLLEKLKKLDNENNALYTISNAIAECSSLGLCPYSSIENDLDFLHESMLEICEKTKKVEDVLFGLEELFKLCKISFVAFVKTQPLSTQEAILSDIYTAARFWIRKNAHGKMEIYVETMY